MSRPQSAPTNADDGSTGARGAPRRVADVHARSRRGLAVAAAFVIAAVVAGIVGDGWWLALHLFVVGALLSAISATTQMLAVTWSTSPPPRRSIAAAQRWVLAGGAVALATGRETGHMWLLVAGGTLVLAAMITLAATLIWIRQHSVTDRFAPAIDAYVAAIVAGAAGMALGIVLGAGRAGERFAELRDVHLILNLFGLIGLVIAGTLPYFAATQVRSKMSPLATPTAMRLTLVGLSAGVAVAATGEAIGRTAVVASGLVGYAAGLVALAAMLPVYVPARLRWAGPRIAQLLSGVAWWAAMAVALAVANVRQTNDRQMLQALVIGGFAQILTASLAYLGPVLRGGGHRRLTAGFALTRSWLSLVVGNAAGLAALAGHQRILAATVTVWLADTAVRAGRLLIPEHSDGSSDV